VGEVALADANSLIGKFNRNGPRAAWRRKPSYAEGLSSVSGAREALFASEMPMRQPERARSTKVVSRYGDTLVAAAGRTISVAQRSRVVRSAAIAAAWGRSLL
jgi:hypothetical protein